MTIRATFNGTVVAESDETVVVEGNHYFPPAAVKTEYLEPSDNHTVCSWKGLASYKDVVVNGVRAADGRGSTRTRWTPPWRSKTVSRSGRALSSLSKRVQLPGR